MAKKVKHALLGLSRLVAKLRSLVKKYHFSEMNEIVKSFRQDQIRKA